MLNRGVANRVSPGVPPSKLSHQQDQLESDLSDSSTDCAMADFKKSMFSDRGVAGLKGATSTKGASLQQHHDNMLAVADDAHRRGSAGMVKVKLASASPQWDNKAEVEVDCENPDEVVDKMLQSIVDKFPPTSVISVEKGGQLVQPGAQQNYGGGGYVPPLQHPGAGPPIGFFGPQGPQGMGTPMPQTPGTVLQPTPQGAPGPYGQPIARGMPIPFGNQQLGGPPSKQGTVDRSHPPPPKPYLAAQPVHSTAGTLPPFYPQGAPLQYSPMPPYVQQPAYPKASDSEKEGVRSLKKHSTASSTTSQQLGAPSQSTITQQTTDAKPIAQGLIHEIPKFVPKVEVRELIKEVPKLEVEWVEKVVEVPQVTYVDKFEEVPQVHEVVKHVARVETIDVPREVVKYVPKVITKIVENVVEVPRGEKIPVMRPQPVDTAVVVPRFQDRNVPVIMSQTIVPEIEETDEVVEVEVCKYVPYLVPVDVYVPLPVTVSVNPKNEGEQTEQPRVNADPNLLQHLMIEMNPHLQQLEMFNFQQQEQFQSLITQSIQQARENGVSPPQPIMNGPTIPSANMGPLSANVTSSFARRQKSGMSRSSSVEASRRNGTRHVSRRVTGTMGASRSTSQLPTTMVVSPPPPISGYSPLYSSGPQPMGLQPPQYLQAVPPTLHSSQGLGSLYNTTNSTAGLAVPAPGGPNPMVMGQSHPTNAARGEPALKVGQSEKHNGIVRARQTSRLTNSGDPASRQLSNGGIVGQ